MSFSQFFSNLKRYDENAAVIFDRAEPVGQPTDLVMPRRRWFQRTVRSVAAVGADPRRTAFPQEEPGLTPPATNS